MRRDLRFASRTAEGGENFLPLRDFALKQTNIAVPATAKQDFKSASAIGGQVKAKKDYRFEIGNLKEKTRRGSFKNK